MLDTRVRIRVAAAPAPKIRGPRSRLELELREMADDLAGCLDRDELGRDDEQLITDAMDGRRSGDQALSSSRLIARRMNRAASALLPPRR
jgi:hypothetical protein